ncbi:MAG: accessory gene regulator ArgB-like protein [Bacillota bacterium]
MIHTLAHRIAEYLNQELNVGDARKAVIAYGLEILLGGMVKLLSFLAIPSVLGILPQTWAALLASAFFRLPSGGAHCTAYYRCLVGVLVTFSLIGLLSKTTVSYMPVDLLALIALGAAVMVTALWAPAGTPAKPVHGSRERRKARVWAIAVLAFYLYLWYRHDIPRDLLLAGSLGLLSQAFTVSPAGYRAMATLDRFLALIPFPFSRKEVTR